MAGPSCTKILVAALIWGVVTSVPALPQDRDHQGVWVGSLEAGGEWWFLQFELTRAGDGLEGSVSIPGVGLVDVPFSQIVASEAALTLVFSGPTGSWRLQGVVHGNLFTGTAQFQDEPGDFRLFLTVPPTAAEIDTIVGSYDAGSRHHLLLVRGDRTDDVYLFDGRTCLRLFPIGQDRFFSPRGDQVRVVRSLGDGKNLIIWENRFGIEVQYVGSEPYRQEKSNFEAGGTQLGGTLFLPHREGPHPAIVIVQGLEPWTSEVEQIVAHQFASAGIAALFYNKSAPGLTFGELVEDTIAAVNQASRNTALEPTQIGLVGLGEGGWITTLTAVRSDKVALVVTVSGSGVSPTEQEQFRVASRVAQATGSERILDIALKLTRLVFDLPDWAIRWPTLAVLRRFPRIDLNYDPAVDLSRLEQPLLAVFGELDRLVPVGLSARRFIDLSRDMGNTSSSALIFRQADHQLFEVGAGSDPGWDAERRYAPGIWRSMTQWVTAVANGTDPPRRASGTLVPDDLPIEPTFPQNPSWFGSASVQLGLLALFGLAFASALLVIPIWALFRRFLRIPQDGTESARLWAWMISLWNVALLAGCAVLADRLLQMIAGDVVSVDRLLRILVSLAAVSAVGALVLIWSSARLWRDGLGGRFFRSYLLLITTAALLVLPFVSFWDLVPF